MTPLSESLNAQAIRELGETKCPHCGLTKSRKQSFCRVCYHRLPNELRMKLYRAFGDGYVDAWVAAKDWLKEN